jgi:2'-5' RNA ligase
MNSEKYLLAIIPPKPVADYVDNFRQQYDVNNLFSISPHITVYPPFYSSESEPSLINKLNNIYNKSIPFRISLDSVGFFIGKNNVAFFKPDSKSGHQIRNLFKAVQLCLADVITDAWPNYPVNPEQFVPHCTIAEKIPQNEFPDIRHNLESLLVNQDFVVDSVFLLRKKPENWFPISEIGFN